MRGYVSHDDRISLRLTPANSKIMAALKLAGMNRNHLFNELLASAATGNEVQRQRVEKNIRHALDLLNLSSKTP